MSGKAGQGLRAALLAAAVACLVPNVTAYAIEGWNKAGDEWQYLNREDQPVTNAFKKSKEDWFYLDDSGTLLKDRIFSFGGDDYYVDPDGAYGDGGCHGIFRGSPGAAGLCGKLR